MMGFRTAKCILIGSMLVALGVLWIWQAPAALWLAVCTINAAAALLVLLERRERTVLHREEIRKLQETSIRILHHHRHDWMNDLQLIYGYLRLNKPDKMQACVENIRERMNAESRISRLGAPELVLYLQAFRTAGRELLLEIDVQGEVSLEAFGQAGERAAAALVECITTFRHQTLGGSEQSVLHIAFASLPSGSIAMKLELQGQIDHHEVLRRKLNHTLEGSPLQVVQMAPDGTTLELRLDEAS